MSPNNPTGDFHIKKIILPSGAQVEVVYFEVGEKRMPMRPISEDDVQEFTDALALDLITPEDFK